MRYLMMAMRTENETPPDEALFVEMDKFVKELSAAGILVATGGLDPVGMQVVAKDGEITVTDGPYTEAKETVGGFALIDVRSVEELHEVSRRFIAITGDGVGRIHQVFS
ncbi:YciI family protein [Kibdelosporangium philippinense]|uniref:YciI family protein n=1 Tax=Kibdelosporangium philippinense TaxID=211113 RepID=A0ABS8Z7I8_9PSEU|nr:YciI family protein [Kibdelosporangium philippinense]MCE7003785.1 YciI family protein [Kibdelosporangium philippinense]